MRIAAVLTLVLALSGCAVGNRHSLDAVSIQTQATTKKSIALAGWDQRSYVVSGKSPQSFVGMQRGGFGNPFNVTTESGRAAAAEFSRSIQVALENRGIRVGVIETTPSQSEQGVIAALVATGKERLVLLTINEWIADTHINTGLDFDLTLNVLDGNGKQIASSTEKGHRDLGGDPWVPSSHAKAVVPKAYKEILERLINSQQISAALN